MGLRKGQRHSGQFVSGDPRARKGRAEPNKLTSVARQAWTKAWEELAPEVGKWIREVHDGAPESPDGPPRPPDPAKAAELSLRLAEYHVPKVREPPVQVQADAEGGKVTVVVQTYTEETE